LVDAKEGSDGEEGLDDVEEDKGDGRLKCWDGWQH
jgi:hypothetical protein